MRTSTRVVSVVCVLVLLELVLVSGVEYTFKRYSYKKKRDANNSCSTKVDVETIFLIPYDNKVGWDTEIDSFCPFICHVCHPEIISRAGLKNYESCLPNLDRRYKHAKERCERSGMCEQRYGVDFIKCLRTCMSEKCYDELYGHDELEEGEVDVRLNSFKGCLYQQPFPDI